MPGGREALVHGTGIAIGARGILLRGAPGTGKSDLALRALSGPVSVLFPEVVRLVADDQVVVTRTGTALWMEAPVALRGLIEVRGVGIVELAREAVAAGPVRLVMIADLVSSCDAVERMPEPDSVDVDGVRVAGVKLFPFEASAALKLRLAVAGLAI